MNIAEILIRSRDQFTQQTEQAKREMESLGRSGQSASRQLEEGGHRSRKSLSEAREAATGLSEVVGVHLPRSVSQFLAHSQSIGPILAASFSAVAVIQLIEVLGHLPEVFDKISGAITGWDEVARKAYDHFLEENKKAIEAATEFQVKMAEISGGKEAGIHHAIALQEAEAKRNLATVAGLDAELRKREEIAAELAKLGEAGAGAAAFLSADELATRKKAQDAAIEAGIKLIALRRQLTEETVKGDKDSSDERQKQYLADLGAVIKIGQFWNEQTQDFINRTGTAGEAVAASLKVADDVGKAVIKDFQDILKLEEEAGDNLIKFNQWKEQQLQDFRNRSIAGGPMAEEVKAGLEANDIREKGIRKGLEEAKKAHEDFVRSFREGAGKVWDDFFIQGKHILTSLADLARALFNQIGRTLFQNFATGLLTGGKTGGSGGVGAFAGNLGAGLGAKAGLGALFGGGGAAATSAVSGSLATGAVGIINPATGALVTGTSAGATGGVAGALGLGGGAGLFGLGAATIPVIGGIALGAFLLARHFLGHRTQEAPFTKDPFTESQHMVEFYTSAQVQATRDLRIAIEHLKGIPPDEVVTQGMPLAFQSSNQFRRNMTSTLMDDV